MKKFVICYYFLVAYPLLATDYNRLSNMYGNTKIGKHYEYLDDREYAYNQLKEVISRDNLELMYMYKKDYNEHYNGKIKNELDLAIKNKRANISIYSDSIKFIERFLSDYSTHKDMKKIKYNLAKLYEKRNHGFPDIKRAFELTYSKRSLKKLIKLSKTKKEKSFVEFELFKKFFSEKFLTFNITNIDFTRKNISFDILTSYDIQLLKPKYNSYLLSFNISVLVDNKPIEKKIRLTLNNKKNTEKLHLQFNHKNKYDFSNVIVKIKGLKIEKN